MRIDSQVIEYLTSYFLRRKGHATIGGNLLPDTNQAFNLGDPTNKFATLYVQNVVADNITGAGGAADTVDGFHAYSSPQPNALLALNASSVFPITVYPQALLLDGSRTLTGNLAVSSGVTIDGVDISAHAADSTIHHIGGMGADQHAQYVHLSTPRTITAQHSFAPGAAAAPFTLGANAQGQTVTGLKADQLNKTLTAGNGLTGGGDWTANRTLSVLLKGTSGLEVDGTGLAVANTIAGAGLTITNKVMAVGAGALIAVDADAVRVTNGTAQYQVPMTGATPFTPAWTALSSLAGNGIGFLSQFSITLKATSGLEVDGTGLSLADTVAGAGLSIASKILQIGQGNGIQVDADAISVKLKTLSGLSLDASGLELADSVAGGGLLISNKVIAINDAIAGAGLTINSKVLSVGEGTLMSVSADAVGLENGTAAHQLIITGATPFTPAYRDLSTLFGAGLSYDVDNGVASLGLPSSVDASTENVVSANSHSHAVVASANPGAATSLLETTPEGALTLASLAVTGAMTVTQDLTVGANVLFADVSQGGVGINRTPDPQFALDVNGNMRASGYIVGKHALQLEKVFAIYHWDGLDSTTDFTGETRDHMGRAPLEMVSPWFVKGKFGKGYVPYGQVDNFILNPAFGVNITDGVTLDTGIVASAVVHSGINAMQLYRSSSGAGRVIQYAHGMGQLQNGETIVFSIYTVAVSNGIPLCALGFLVDGVESLSATFTVSSTTRRSFSYTNNTGLPVTVVPIFKYGTVSGTTYRIRLYRPMMHRSTTALGQPYEYLDGTFTAVGVYWSGTPHFSASVKPASRYRINTANMNAGSTSRVCYSFWYYNDGYQRNYYPVAIYHGSSYSVYITLGSPSDTKVHYRYLNGSWRDKIADIDPVIGWNHVVYSWDTSLSASRVWINGVQSTLSGDTTVQASIGAPTSLYIGSDDAYANHAGQIMDDLAIIYDYPITDEFVLAIYQSGAPVFAETSTWSFRSTSNLVWADSEGLWAMDDLGNPAFGVSGVLAKSWGGATLDRGDILMGRASNYIKWNASLGTLTFYNAQSSLAWEEYFDGTLADILTRWTNYTGTGEVYLLIGSGSAGGNALSIGNNAGNDERRYISNQSIPYDPSKLYKFTIRVRRTAGTGVVYLGVAGRNAADTEWVNASGINDFTGQFYVAANMVSPGTDWTEYVGYFTGLSSTPTANIACPNPSAPGSLHTNVRYIRLLMMVNASSLAGTTDVDMIKVEIVPKTTDSPWRHATDTTTIDGGKIYTGSVTADKITATTLSAITANMGTLTAGEIVIGSTNKLWLNNGGDGWLAIGGSVKGSAPFRVEADGKLTATNAVLTGSITAASGAIGGWSIGADSLTSSGIKMYANATLASNKIYVGSGNYANADTAILVDGSGRLSLKDKLKWDGTNLSIYGGVVIGAGTAFVADNALLHLPFDGPGPYATNFQVDTNGHLGQRATESGGVIGRPGKFGKGVQLAEAVTNLCANPSFETGVAGGWSTFIAGDGAAATFTQDTTTASIGSASGKLAITNGGTGVGSVQLYYRPFSATAGQPYTVSFKIRASTAVVIPAGIHQDGSPYAGYSTTNINVTTEWQKVVLSLPSATLTEALRVILQCGNKGAITVWIDEVQIEQKAYPTPYCDGSLGTGHSWTVPASPHTSTSSRSLSALYYDMPNFPTRSGSMSYWYYDDGFVRNDYLVPFVNQGLGGGYIDIYMRYGGNLTPRMASSDGVTTYTTNPYTTTTTLGWNHVVGTWNVAEGMKLYLNGVLIGSSPNLAVPYGTAIRVYPGSYGNGYANTVIDDFVILDRVLSANEVESIYKSGTPIVVKTNPFELMLAGSGQAKVWGNAYGLFGQNSAGSPSFALVNENGVSWNSKTLDSGDILFGSDNAYVLFDKSAALLEVKGKILATDGLIGNWTIASDRLVRDTGTNNQSSGLAPADLPFYAGRTYANRADAPFRVTTAGVLYATSANITGAVTATSGSFTGAITATSGSLGSLSVTGTLIAGTAGAARIELSSSQLAGYNSSNVRQFWIDGGTGAAFAGANNDVSLSSTGISILNPTATGATPEGSYKFMKNGTLISAFQSWLVGAAGINYTSIVNQPVQATHGAAVAVTDISATASPPGTGGNYGYGAWARASLTGANSRGDYARVSAIGDDHGYGWVDLYGEYTKVTRLALKYAAWNESYLGDGGATIVNDNGSYKALMLVGNSSAGAGRRNVYIYDDLYLPSGSIRQSTPVFGKFRRSVNQSIGTASWTAIVFDSADAEQPSDLDMWWAGNGSVIYSKISGWYLVIGTTEFAGNATGSRGIAIVKGGTVYHGSLLVPAGNTMLRQLTTSTMIYLAANETIQLMAYQDSGGFLDVVSGGTHEKTSLSIYKIV